MLKFGLITLFPEMFEPFLSKGVVGRAIEKGLIQTHFYYPRDFAEDAYKTVDDRPYGGGPGMVMMAEPLYQAIQAAKTDLPAAKVYYLSPQGKTFTQAQAVEMQAETEIIMLSGRYEGVDERLIETAIDEEISIGDYVLSGGELASLVLMDAIARLVPGVLHHEDSAKEDSFSENLLDCAHYTRPEVWRGMPVPSVLLGGNHAEIKKWRAQEARKRTLARRPDLLKKPGL